MMIVIEFGGHMVVFCNSHFTFLQVQSFSFFFSFPTSPPHCPLCFTITVLQLQPQLQHFTLYVCHATVGISTGRVQYFVKVLSQLLNSTIYYRTKAVRQHLEESPQLYYYKILLRSRRLHLPTTNLKNVIKCKTDMSGQIVHSFSQKGGKKVQLIIQQENVMQSAVFKN